MLQQNSSDQEPVTNVTNEKFVQYTYITRSENKRKKKEKKRNRRHHYGIEATIREQLVKTIGVPQAIRDTGNAPSSCDGGNEDDNDKRFDNEEQQSSLTGGSENSDPRCDLEKATTAWDVKGHVRIPNYSNEANKAKVVDEIVKYVASNEDMGDIRQELLSYEANKKDKLVARSYVDQDIDDELNNSLFNVLSRLNLYETRAKALHPTTAYTKTRLVKGLSNISRSLARDKLKLVVIAPNIEPTLLRGGADDLVTDIILKCKEKEVPVVFGLSKNKLGKTLKNGYRQSALGICNVEGVRDEVRSILVKTESLRLSFRSREEGCSG